MIKLQRPSSAISEMYVSPETNVITVTFKGSGATKTYTDVNANDIENLLSDTTVSLGKFTNQVLIGRRVDVLAQAVAA